VARLARATHDLNDGRRIELRSATAGDARAVVAFKRDMLATARHLNEAVDEFALTPRREAAWIASRQTGDRDLMLLAMDGERIAGLLETRHDPRRRLAHTCEIGLSVAPPWQRQGIGRALLTALLAWARGNPHVARVQLHVHAANGPAIALYRDLGFVEEGRRRRAIRLDDGEFVDDLIMCAYVGAPAEE